MKGEKGNVHVMTLRVVEMHRSILAFFLSLALF
jgi:hypothetical protein